MFPNICSSIKNRFLGTRFDLVGEYFIRDGFRLLRDEPRRAPSVVGLGPTRLGLPLSVGTECLLSASFFVARLAFTFLGSATYAVRLPDFICSFSCAENRVMVTDFLGAVASFVTWESVIWVSPFGVGAAVVLARGFFFGSAGFPWNRGWHRACSFCFYSSPFLAEEVQVAGRFGSDL